MSFARYPTYKDSGVEWLGKVPAHWKTAPLKSVSTHNDEVLDERTAPDAEIVYVDISSVDAVNGIKTKEGMLFSAAPSRARRRVKHGDVIVSTVRTYLKAIAKISDPEENLIVSTGFAVIRPRGELMPDFLGHLVAAGFFVEQVIAHSTGVSYPAINASELVAILVPVPPFSEQTQIAAFLDRETAKIDGLVAEQRRLMALLKEKRQATISHAVTQGLNPDAPIKPSGIEWLGDVPAHWNAKRLRDVANLNPSKSEIAALERNSLVSFLPMSAIGEDGSLSFDFEKPIGELESGYTYFRDGDVAIAKITPCYENGKGALMHGLTQGIGFGTTELIVVRPKPERSCGEFLHFLFISTVFRNIGKSYMYGAGGQKRVPDDFVRNFATGFPPAPEQVAIAAFLEAELAKFDTLTAEAQRAIDLLQERRTALISAAVTGQIDVRAIANSL